MKDVNKIKILSYDRMKGATEGNLGFRLSGNIGENKLCTKEFALLRVLIFKQILPHIY